MDKKVVNNWRIIVSGDRYCAPEIRRFHLQGDADWVDPPDNKLTSSPIVGKVDDAILTKSGSIYHLGEPEHNGIRTLDEMIERFPGVPLR